MGSEPQLRFSNATGRSVRRRLQDELARILLHLADEQEPVPLTAGERAAIAESKAAGARGEFASDEEVRAVCASFGL